MINMKVLINVLVITLLVSCNANKETVKVQTTTSSSVGHTSLGDHGTTNHIKWTSSCTWSNDSDSIAVEIIAEIEEGWHLYSQILESDEGPLATIFTFTESDSYSIDGKVAESEAKDEYDKNFAMNIRFFEKKAVFTQLISRKSSLAFKLNGNVNYMVCNDEMCLPPTDVPLIISIGKK